MGHIKPKRKVCYQTADGVLHKSKKEADFHISRLVSKLQTFKNGLKSLVERQKLNKINLVKTLEHYRIRLVDGYGSAWAYVKMAQKEVDKTSDEIRYAHRNIEAVKKALRGE